MPPDRVGLQESNFTPTRCLIQLGRFECPSRSLRRRRRGAGYGQTDKRSETRNPRQQRGGGGGRLGAPRRT